MALLKEVERYQDSTRSTNSATEKPAEEVKPAGEKPVEVKPAVETEKPAEKAAEPKAEDAKARWGKRRIQVAFAS
ncbi:MAG: hypothetical protein U0894_08435 [Pirellulales bacterium]